MCKGSGTKYPQNNTERDSKYKCPTCNGTGYIKPKRVATVELTRDPYQEWTDKAPEEDYRNEGFEYLQFIGARIDGATPAELWRNWHEHPRYLWVIRFKVVELFDDSEFESQRWRDYQLQTGGTKPLIRYPQEQTVERSELSLSQS